MMAWFHFHSSFFIAPCCLLRPHFSILISYFILHFCLLHFRQLSPSLSLLSTEGKTLAASRDAKFIETSSGIQHNVDELLVGILKQVSPRAEQSPGYARVEPSPSLSFLPAGLVCGYLGLGAKYTQLIDACENCAGNNLNGFVVALWGRVALLATVRVVMWWGRTRTRFRNGMLINENWADPGGETETDGQGDRLCRRGRLPG